MGGKGSSEYGITAVKSSPSFNEVEVSDIYRNKIKLSFNEVEVRDIYWNKIKLSFNEVFFLFS